MFFYKSNFHFLNERFYLFRLWNSTLVEDYPRVDEVKIGSNAKIVIPPNVIIQQENLKDDYAIVSIIQ